MAKKISDYERLIAFVTTAPEAEVKTALETAATIARARGFDVGGRKKKSAKPAATTRRRREPSQTDATDKTSTDAPASSAAAAGS